MASAKQLLLGAGPSRTEDEPSPSTLKFEANKGHLSGAMFSPHVD